MIRLAVGTTCPRCHRPAVRRIPRRRWMRLIPFSVHLECTRCLATFLVVFHLVSIQTG